MSPGRAGLCNSPSNRCSCYGSFAESLAWNKAVCPSDINLASPWRKLSVSHNREEWVRGDVSTQSIESVWSLLDRSIIGSFHQLSAKHLPAYLDEISFRFNNRENPYLFRDTLLALLTGEALTYEDLTADA